MSGGCGCTRFGAAANVTDSNGNAWDASSPDGCPVPASCTPIQKRASTFASEAGAQCGSPARWDLCGGPPARAVPTATGGGGADVASAPVGVLGGVDAELVAG